MNPQNISFSGRERIIKTLNHEPTDRLPIDLGGTFCSGAHVSIIAKLRQTLGLDKPGDPVKIYDPYQMLGFVEADLRDALQLDVVVVPGPKNMFGFENADWKPWTTFDGTNVLVPGKFNTTPDANGDILQYPEGDRSVPASARMPKGGFYFDSVIRQEPIDEAKLNPEDNLQEFGPISDEDLKIYEKQTTDLYDNTNLALVAGFGGTAFGDIALVPAPFLKHSKGIRDIEEWYISTAIRRDYIKEVFARQADIAVENLKKAYQAVGDKIQIVWMDGA
ncbi:MAG: uroporphyrinogen decarboxylase family protein, partial [Planctomycetota bacterium]